MLENFDLEEIELQIKKIESEILSLLRLISKDSIPNRITMINRDYFKRLQKYDIIKSEYQIQKAETLIPNEPKNTVQFIKSILLNIPNDLIERKRYLEKLFGYFGSICSNDKEVLIQSLLHQPTEKIRTAIEEILETFS
ncbi:MAG: hypothetical protein JW776_15795 [Candidatus Lokiarchaeota archaeon]|nr:hypothetical protein [Candidatus Lokiarchaeota archaeon]